MKVIITMRDVNGAGMGQTILTGVKPTDDVRVRADIDPSIVDTFREVGKALGAEASPGVGLPYMRADYVYADVHIEVEDADKAAGRHA